MDPTDGFVLLAACDRADDERWVSRIDFSGAAASLALLVLGSAERADGANTMEGATVAPARRAIPVTRLKDGSPFPDFGAIIEALKELSASACLLVGEGSFTSLVRLAADELGVAVFTLVESERQLSALGRRTKARPDLQLIASADLLPGVQDDPGYGSTILPIGHPGRERLSSASAGDRDRAATRLVSAIDRWHRNQLEPPVPDLSVVVPAYNEEDNLPAVCERLLDALAPVAAEILIVDDMSRDGTLARARDEMWRSPRIRAFTKPLPRGMGNAVRYGMARSRARYIGITMGDGSDDVTRLPEMLANVKDGGYGLAIGSRYRHRQNFEAVPYLYRFWSAIFRRVAWLLTGLRLSDYTNAFRVVDRRVFDRYGAESGGFEISPEITFRAWYATRRVAEVDVRQLKRAAGQSNFSFLRAGPGYGKILIKAFVQRLTGRWFVLDW